MEEKLSMLQILIIDRVLQANQQNQTTLQKIQELAKNIRQNHSELVKESDIIAQTLTDYMNNSLNISSPVKEPKVQRLYIDGCFDLMHSGHFNAIRQAKELCDTLVVGVISSEAISIAKGPPIMSLKERVVLVKACKWVDEVVEGVDYDPTIALLDSLNCSHVAHGDDLVQTSDGQDAYYPFKKSGRMKIFKRTEGISTTDIVGRLLLLTKEIMWEEKKLFKNDSGEGIEASNIDLIQQQQVSTEVQDDIALLEHSINKNKILNTTRRIRQFSNNKKPQPGDVIVYIDGSFDILHEGHIQILQKARAKGDFLYVGVYDNETINKFRGKNYPILNLQERVLNLLAIKFVDDVIIGAPYQITHTMIKNFKISLVIEGSSTVCRDQIVMEDSPYFIPKSLGIYHIMDSEVQVTADQLANRIVQNRLKYLQKFASKAKKDKAFEEQHKYEVEEI